ncbi:MAG: hypothetical protein FRC54_01665 [bacterium LCO1.1]|uniref:Uncharacterized protein n=1 Tax=Candidatus Weimeria bifida TaxID=2599074 RepID=A0A6N7IXH2_9FIRM|nr:hypothetical protein [Candidatus Weimeria bifida]
MKRNSQQEKSKKTEDAGLEKVYTIEERVYPKRVAALLIFVVSTVLFVAFDACMSSLATGGLICEAIVIIPASLAVLLYLIHERRADGLWYRDTDYMTFALIYLVSGAIVSALSLFLPGVFIPAGLIAFILASTGDGALSVSASLLPLVSLAFSHRYGGNIYALFFCEVIIAVSLARLIVKSKTPEKVLLFLAVTAVYAALPASIRYFEKIVLSKKDLFFAGGMSIITAACAVILLPALYKVLHRERRDRYETILDDDYSLIKEIRLFSEEEYDRARRLSIASLRAAREIGADAALAAAGGLYYRVGLIRGDKEIDYAMQIAAENDFPDQLTRILYEYRGLIRKPTSKESAIVHMADAVMERLDAISKESDRMKSDWNKQMLIYSSLNELSSSGYYDDSTITMNQFLKIRDILVKELE